MGSDAPIFNCMWNSQLSYTPPTPKHTLILEEPTTSNNIRPQDPSEAHRSISPEMPAPPSCQHLAYHWKEGKTLSCKGAEAQQHLLHWFGHRKTMHLGSFVFWHIIKPILKNSQARTGMFDVVWMHCQQQVRCLKSVTIRLENPRKKTKKSNKNSSIH